MRSLIVKRNFTFIYDQTPPFFNILLIQLVIRWSILISFNVSSIDDIFTKDRCQKIFYILLCYFHWLFLLCCIKVLRRCLWEPGVSLAVILHKSVDKLVNWPSEISNVNIERFNSFISNFNGFYSEQILSNWCITASVRISYCNRSLSPKNSRHSKSHYNLIFSPSNPDPLFLSLTSFDLMIQARVHTLSLEAYRNLMDWPSEISNVNIDGF